MKAPDFLNKAAKHMQDRAATYDKPEGERSMATAVAAFNAIYGTHLTEYQGWRFMELLKIVRSSHGVHQDSLEDAIAYGALAAEARLKERPVQKNPIVLKGRILEDVVSPTGTTYYSIWDDSGNQSTRITTGSLYGGPLRTFADAMAMFGPYLCSHSIIHYKGVPLK